MNVIGISGSLRKASVNTGLLRTVFSYLKESPEPPASFELLDYASLPMYNGDLEPLDSANRPTAQLNSIVDKLSSADLIVFAIPEHNFLPPAVLKNLVDWISRVSPDLWKQTPISVIGSAGGTNGLKSRLHFSSTTAVFTQMTISPSQLSYNAFGPLANRSTGDWNFTTDQHSEISQWWKDTILFCNSLNNNSTTNSDSNLSLVALVGSLRKFSTNKGVYRAMKAGIEKDSANQIVEVQEVSNLPWYEEWVASSDDGVPEIVAEFLQRIEKADGVLLFAPEYNYSITGPMSNALAWAGHFETLTHKAVLLTGSGGGVGTSWAQWHLRQVAVLQKWQVMNKSLTLRAFDAGNFDFSTGDKSSGDLSNIIFYQPTSTSTSDKKEKDTEKLQWEASNDDSTKVLVFPSTTLESKGLAKALVENTKLDNVEVQVARNIESVPMYNGDLEALESGFPKSVLSLADQVKSADAIIFVIAESTGLLSSRMKNALDWVSRVEGKVWENKTASVVGVGALNGAHVAYHHLRTSGVFLNIHFCQLNAINVPTTAEYFENDELISEKVKERLEPHVSSLVEMALRLKPSDDSSSSTPDYPTIKILGISGSARTTSANVGLLRAAGENLPPGVELEIVDSDLLNAIPMFNEDLEAEGVPEPVKVLKEKIKTSDALLFASPEHNFSVTALMKNTCDWLSRGSEKVVSGKPAALISTGGGLGGARSQHAFRQLAVFLNLNLLNTPTACVREFETGVTDMATGDLKSDESRKKVEAVVTHLRDFARKF